MPVQRAALRSDEAGRAGHLAATYAAPPQLLSELDCAQREVGQVQLIHAIATPLATGANPTGDKTSSTSREYIPYEYDFPGTAKGELDQVLPSQAASEDLQRRPQFDIFDLEGRLRPARRSRAGAP